MENKNEKNTSLIPTSATGLVRVGNSLEVTKKILNGLSKRIQYIRIGCQEWACENLFVNEFRNGDAIPLISSNEEWKKLKTPAYCYYNNDKENGITYGLLYNWYAVNDYRELAPDKWGIATENDWSILNHFLGLTDAGKLLESKSIWQSDTKGLDSFKFHRLPNGYRDSNGEFDYLGVNGYLWTKTEKDEKIALARILNVSKNIIDVDGFEKECGMAVCCVRKVIDNQNEMSFSLLEKVKDRKKSKDYKKSIEIVSKAIEINPGYQEAYFYRGLYHFCSGNQEEAIFNYNISIYLKETDEAFLYRGFSKERLQDLSGAIEDFSKSISINPKMGIAYYRRGIAKFKLKDYEGARMDQNTAEKLNDKFRK